jgi:lipoprotein-releasing system ATP-binding protein
MTAILEAQALRKVYRGGDGNPIEVLSGVDFTVSRGEFVAIVGASGSGKSTLLHLLGALDSPSGGTVRLAGQAYETESPEGLAALRNRKVGFVFQFHHLLREFSALENVMMPQLIHGTGVREARDRARELLAGMGLEERATHKPAQLSGGEQQRVAVARALANRPLVLLADEPSGNLDPETAEALHDEFFRICRDEGAALVLVTHDLALAARAGRVLRLHAGHLVPAAPADEAGMLD